MTHYDIYDAHDYPTGKVASYDDVHKKGLWHRGAHVIIHTPDNEILMQKRSSSLKFHPNEIEISVGGGVDAGESPEQAIIREIKEEIGMEIKPGELNFIGKQIYNHQTKTQLKRVHIYNYSVCMPRSKINITKNNLEVECVFFIKKSKLRTALLKHRIKNIGKISSQYAYWTKLLNSI